jgi:hypothetical protein
MEISKPSKFLAISQRLKSVPNTPRPAMIYERTDQFIVQRVCSEPRAINREQSQVASLEIKYHVCDRMEKILQSPTKVRCRDAFHSNLEPVWEDTSE